MHRNVITAVWISLFATAALAAQKWPSIGKFAMPDGSTATVFIDLGGDGMTRHGDFWTAKQKTLFSSPQKEASGASFRSEADVYAYDCKGNRTALVSYTRFEGEDISGVVVDKIERSSPSEYEWITPTAGSVLERASKFVCGFAAMKR